MEISQFQEEVYLLLKKVSPFFNKDKIDKTYLNDLYTMVYNTGYSDGVNTCKQCINHIKGGETDV
jgi:hypothetical protein